jgi:hypothetical protein
MELAIECGDRGEDLVIQWIKYVVFGDQNGWSRG